MRLCPTADLPDAGKAGILVRQVAERELRVPGYDFKAEAML